MSLMPYLQMSLAEAARLREATMGQLFRLDPIEVRGGKYKGSYVLPRRVMLDENFAENRDAFGLMTEIYLEASEAFPPDPEELARQAALDAE